MSDQPRPARRAPDYPGPDGPCEKSPRDRSLVRDQPWANVCPGASPYRLDGPRAAVNGRRSSPIWVTAAARLRRAARLARRPVALSAPCGTARGRHPPEWCARGTGQRRRPSGGVPARGLSWPCDVRGAAAGGTATAGPAGRCAGGRGGPGGHRVRGGAHRRGAERRTSWQPARPGRLLPGHRSGARRRRRRAGRREALGAHARDRHPTVTAPGRLQPAGPVPPARGRHRRRRVRRRHVHAADQRAVPGVVDGTRSPGRPR